MGSNQSTQAYDQLQPLLTSSQIQSKQPNDQVTELFAAAMDDFHYSPSKSFVTSVRSKKNGLY
jgi:hypothetical protein